MKYFVQETRSRVLNNFSAPLLPAFCTGDNGNKVKVANHSPTRAAFFFTSSRLVNTSCYVTRTLFPTRKSYTRYIRHHQNGALTLVLPWHTSSFRHQLGFSWKHSSHAAIAQRLFTHMSTTVCSQALIYTAASTEAPWRERKCPNFETVSTGIRTRALSIASPAFYHWATALHGARYRSVSVA